jgi:hypothetical protein
MLGLYWLGGTVYQKAITASESFSLALAAVVLIGLGLEVLMSRHKITNNGILFPRRSRILLFFGYIVLAATSVAFWASLKIGSKQLLPIFSSPDSLVQFGLAGMAPCLLVSLFILRLGRTFADVTGGTVDAPETARVPETIS